MFNLVSYYAETLAKYVTELSFDDLPLEVIEKAKECVLDSVACAIGGFYTEVGSIMSYIVEYIGGEPQSTVLGNGKKTSCLCAAFTNSMIANALDFDDFHAEDGHPGATVIPPALAIAEDVEASGKALLKAVVAGYEVSIRIGKAIRPSFERSREVFGYGTYQTFGAVSAVGSLLGLTEEEMCNAFGIAGANAPVPSTRKTVYSHLGPTMVKNNYGSSSFVGTTAAMMAKQGFRGPKDILDGSEGFWRMYSSDKCDFSAITQNLEEKFEILRIAYKPYPCCSRITPSIDAALEIARENKLNPDDIEEMVVRSVRSLTEQEQRKPFSKRPPKSMVEAQFCAPYMIAVALLGVEPGPLWYSKDQLRDPRVLKLGRKVKLIDDPELDKLAYSSYPSKTISEVTIKTDKGSYSKRIEFAKGEPENPLNVEWLENKFRKLASQTAKQNQIENALKAFRNLEKAKKVNDIIEQLFNS